MTRPFVIFDFDGTVADSFAESLLAYNRIAPRLRLRAVKEAEISDLRRMGAGQLMQALGIPMWKLPRLMIAARADLHDHFHNVKPVPGIPEAIRGLHEADYHLAMVTSNSEDNVRNFLDRHGIVGFDTVIAGASIFGKATRLRRLIKAMGANRTSTVYIGDTVPDIRAAREAGTLAVAVAWGFTDPAQLATETPDALVNSPSELQDAIMGLLGRSFSIPARST
jgi:phosphoglycolate phosphatase